MQVFQGKAVPIKAWVDGVEFEDSARKQVENLASMPFVFKHVAVMPDVHWGRGATVGSVIATKGAIIPAAVGVDIGCGMTATRLDLKGEDLPDGLHELRLTIEAAVPHGRTDNGGANDRGAWVTTPERIVRANERLMREYLEDVHARVPDQRFRTRWTPSAIARQCGTLGSGNHYIEVCLDENADVWVVVHSGSRGVGNAIGTYYINRAREECERWFVELPDKDLAYLPEGAPLFDEYVAAVGWAQAFAKLNRSLIREAAVHAVRQTLGRQTTIMEEVIDCHHNYVEREQHFGQNVLVTRKGAVRAREGDLGIIPGSMGARSYIVCGKGNPESFNSCSHGAGRRMSRGEAKRTITMDQHAAAVAGIECRVDADVIDESPAAYKSIDAVLEAERDLVEVVHTLRQVVCVKG